VIFKNYQKDGERKEKNALSRDSIYFGEPIRPRCPWRFGTWVPLYYIVSF
jgi:hypothetical protein